jgi:hypothetical protein
MDIKINVINHLKKLVHFLNGQKIAYAFAGEFPFSPRLEKESTMDIDIILRVKENQMPVFIGRTEKEFDSILAHDEPMRLRSMKIWRVIHRLDNHLMILNFLLAESVFYKNIFKSTHEIDFFDSKVKILTSEDLPLLKNWTELAQGNSNSDKVKILAQRTQKTQRTGFQCKYKFRPDVSEKVMRYD